MTPPLGGRILQEMSGCMNGLLRSIPYFRLKCVIFPGATFGQASNRAYFSPEALVSRGKMKKKQKKFKKRKKEKKI